MAETFRSSAPAKVNLSLRVLRRREDGFHELHTRMCPISLCDQIELTLADSGGGARLRCDDPQLPLGEENLAMKAVRAYENATGTTFHAEISIEKNIPSGAGLGGGSSDAATVLKLLNQAMEERLSTEELASIAAQIGSDVPFFLYGQTCDATGRGEMISPVEFPHRVELLLVKPPFGVPTPWAYSKWKDSAVNPAYSYEPQSLPIGELVNDLERPVFEKYLVLGDLKRWLLGQEGVSGALMSGSGATVFAILDGSENTDSLETRVKEEFGATFWTHRARVTG